MSGRVIPKKLATQFLVAAATLIVSRLAFDIASAAAYVYPDLDFGQKIIAFTIFIAALLSVLTFALIRLFRKRPVEGVVLLILCYVPFSFDDTVNREFWKFRIHKSEYQSIMQSDLSPPPKFRVFNWGNRNTQLMGGGFIAESIVYDESDEIARWSPGWTERRSNLPQDRWITVASTYPSCKRRTEPFGDHFYYISEEC